MLSISLSVSLYLLSYSFTSVFFSPPLATITFYSENKYFSLSLVFLSISCNFLYLSSFFLISRHSLLYLVILSFSLSLYLSSFFLYLVILSLSRHSLILSISHPSFFLYLVIFSISHHSLYIS